MRAFINNIKIIAYIISLSMVSFNLYADVTMNDSAENLSGAKITTLVPFNNPKTRAAYGLFQVGLTGTPQIYTPNDKLLPDFTNFSNVKAGVKIYYVTVDIRYWYTLNGSPDRVQKDVFLPQGNSYIIDRSMILNSYGSYYHLKTEDIRSSFSKDDFQENSGDLSLNILIQRFLVVNHRCTSKDRSELKEICKGKKYILTLDSIEDDYSIGEVLSVLKPIVSIDINTIPKVVIPGNSNKL